MFKRYAVALFVLMFSFVAGAKTIDMSDPYTMIHQVSSHTFARLKAEQKEIRKNPDYLKTIVAEELMPYVNDKYAALKLLGTNLRGAKRSDVETFIKAFREYLITSYAQVLTQYSDQKIVFGPEPELGPKDRITTITVEIVDEPNPNIRLDFKLRRSRSGEWKAYDMIAEGVSLLSSKQSEWSGKIRQEGILAVAKELKSLSDVSIKLENESNA
ncbi:MlaC/ttg2D family ABC transporter substrate-binding protein [Vibrio salinus]|uniref:MlaC/ttg2D family ABC transporter substrate-binding protein n=1 Tax=Vibrio salinus TaxID=2899784 RepID=UPI001E4A305F|nr:phospholipid-binding protein MlaC [Vibrio salinus]MCE0494064.1 phospholipid-binding protein MlaC [Vibrio salinus]